jgi:hypothetical protein
MTESTDRESISQTFVLYVDQLQFIKDKAKELSAKLGTYISDSAALRMILTEYIQLTGKTPTQPSAE